ncbi:MAG: type IV pili methyl-accepting chemotaxis transducer N-terminal domain-containing protein [Burkholderiales bacterium]|nr:type IV pili methyl-accepting chemotaxis transducer N-terminal domain-containing protein [Burkholderiales bacterium]
MKMAIKLPTFLTPRTNRHEDLAPDTAILEDLLPDDDFDRPPAAARPAPTAVSRPLPDVPAATPEKPPRGARMRMPLVGELPFHKQLQVWLPTLLLSVLLAFVFLWNDARQVADASRWSQQAGDALGHSQRIAKAAPQALLGDASAFTQLRDSRSQFNALLGQLTGTEGGQPVPGDAQAALQKLQQTWNPSNAAAQALLEQETALRAFGTLRREVLRAAPKLGESAQAVLAARQTGNAAARDVAAAGELLALTQRIAKDVNALALADTGEAASGAELVRSMSSLRELADAMFTGSDRLRLAAADGEARRALADIRKSLLEIEPLYAGAQTGLAQLAQARQAERRIFADSETVRAQLDSLRTQLRAGEGGSRWFTWGAALFSVLALIALYGLFRAFLSDSEQRAEGAERQREIAERLEQEAKRTNDQNQAAILRLMNELQEVADGDLTVQATVSEDITGAIADSVNYTVEELRNLVARINTTAELVNDASSKAQMTASSLQAASEQQSREIRDTGEAVLRMARQIHEVSARAAESVQVARQSLGASEEGSRAVNNAISGMNGIRDQIQDTAKRIKRLGESSQEIGEIVELISDITEQTNVLALNAAIQAASAGEAGRGFTIVAEEVQRLAERSAEATKQISALIRTIQTDTQDAVSAMERSTQGVVEGTRLSDEAGRALGEIGKVSSVLAELIEDFSSSTSRQAMSAGTVAQSIQRILLVTEQTSEGTLQTAGSIRQVAELAQELRNSVSRFKVA